MDRGPVDEHAALLDVHVKRSRGSSIKAWMYTRCQLMEMSLGIGVIRQKAEEQVAHLPVACQHLLMSLLQVLEPGIGSLPQLHLALR